MGKSSFPDISSAIWHERRYQNHKWGSVEENPHNVQEWIRIMQRELNEARGSILHLNQTQALREILQVVAVGVACLEQHGVVERGPLDMSELRGSSG